MDGDDKVRENRLRRMAQRRGMQLQKSRRRDPNAIDFGGYMLVDASNAAAFGSDPVPFSLSLDQVDAYLTADARTIRFKGLSEADVVKKATAWAGDLKSHGPIRITTLVAVPNGQKWTAIVTYVEGAGYIQTMR